MDCNTPGFPGLHQLLDLAQTHVHWISDAIQPSHPCHPLLFLPSIFPSIRVFSNESVLHIRWPKYWSFSFSIIPSNEGLIPMKSFQYNIINKLYFNNIFKIYVYFNWSLLSYCHQFSSVKFSHSVVSDPLRPHESQQARPPCPSQTPGIHSNSCPLTRWCHPAISSSVIPFSFCLQSFPASLSFQMSQLFAWGGQSTGVSASASDCHRYIYICEELKFNLYRSMIICSLIIIVTPASNNSETY